jgi:hypothetical protein
MGTTTTLIWDHHRVALWRAGRQGCVMLADGAASNAEAVVDFLESHADALSISRLRIYVDLPGLDHHLERIPQIGVKLQKQLLEQRSKKNYGNEARAWSASPMQLEEKTAHQFHFVSSLPRDSVLPLARWALAAGVYFEGIYSLPQALSLLSADDNHQVGERIEYTALGGAGYLIARNAAGRMLFFNRFEGSVSNRAQLEQSARRLALFTEQEFGVVPQLSADPEIPSAREEASVVAELCRTKLQPSLNLVPRSERARQSRQRLRHRAFVVGIALVGAAALFVLPLLEEKQNLEVEVSALNTGLQSQTFKINQAQQTIEQNKAYRNVIEFSRDRETFKKEDPVPVPLLIMMKSLAQALPDLVELDSYSCEIDSSVPVALIEMQGRPLSPDSDLVEIIDALQRAIKMQGWEVESFEREFKSTNTGGSRFVQRGGLRKFTVSFKLRANAKWRSL